MNLSCCNITYRQCQKVLILQPSSYQRRVKTRPIANFMFCGPTAGVGKTKFCKMLAKSYYGRETKVVSFGYEWIYWNAGDIGNMSVKKELSKSRFGLNLRREILEEKDQWK